ncbi:Uncharacterised protein [Fusobacterium necrogenes]|uniref:Uncharacterized protein n=1 Tax=Fusobacterium necrogenes TaxID=858 RepID=A0A377GXA4_9FUSO|nr:hypothetical protein [Fusobacterium necrogenes]STO31244.1 Uncharacterised protein [Fusobacterium necrogenes]
MFLISSVLSIILLFFLSLLIPVLSFTLPIYKIKKMKRFTTKEKVIINIIIIFLIAIINPWLLFFYVGFFMVIEFLYNYFNNIRNNIKKFDRIVIISIITTVIMAFVLFLLREEINNNIELLMKVYEQQFQITRLESMEIFSMIKENFLYYIFVYSILSVFLVYVSLDIKDYNEWTISFEWLLIYVISFFFIYLLKIDNFYISNFLQIGETIFLFFGIKTLYSYFMSLIKQINISNILAIIVAFMFPFGTFLVGVLGGFKIDKK